MLSTLISTLCILAGALFVGWKLDAMAKAFERYGDRAFMQEEAFRRMERELNLARAKPETKRKRS